MPICIKCRFTVFQSLKISGFTILIPKFFRGLNPLTPELFYQKHKKNDKIQMAFPNRKCLLSDYCFEYCAINETRYYQI